MTFAQRDGMMLICVVMNEEAPSQFLDTATLLDYGFANFRKVDMSEYGQGQDSENSSFFLTQAQTRNADTGLSVRQNGTAVLPVNASVDDVKGEAQAGDSEGTVTSEFYYHGVYVGSSVMRVQAADLRSGSSLLFGGTREETDTTYDIFHPDSGFVLFVNWKYIVIALAGIGVAAGIAFLIMHTGSRKRRRRKPHLTIR